MKDKPVFESAVCGRCGGSGHYSFCTMHGTVCFGCNGRGWKYTKRGAAAAAMFEDSLKVPASELKVGDLMRYEDFFKGKRAFYLVKAIKPGSRENELFIDLHNDKLGDVNVGEFAHNMVRKGFSAEVKKAKLAAALAFEKSLGKNGKALKKLAKAA